MYKGFYDGRANMRLTQQSYPNATTTHVPSNPQFQQLFNPLGLMRTDAFTPNVHRGYNITGAVDIGMNVSTIPRPMNQHKREAFMQNTNAKKNSYHSSSSDDEVDISSSLLNTYMLTLKSRALAVKDFCMQNPAYSPWLENWKFLHKNLMNKSKLDFKLLDASDQDIAYVIDKGSKVCFRLHDNYRYMPINIYQYVLYHEMAHMSTAELQHTPMFHKLLNLLSLAAYELKLIDLKSVTKSLFTTNGQGIASAESLQDEIIMGCSHMIEAHKNNPVLVKYYTDLRQHVAKTC